MRKNKGFTLVEILIVSDRCSHSGYFGGYRHSPVQ
ncbi:MAG: prepilin-type N-terminal cleavage/methylation domain-containing protein [Planctomycetota bacterium]